MYIHIVWPVAPIAPTQPSTPSIPVVPVVPVRGSGKNTPLLLGFENPLPAPPAALEPTPVAVAEQPAKGGLRGVPPPAPDPPAPASVALNPARPPPPPAPPSTIPIPTDGP